MFETSGILQGAHAVFVLIVGYIFDDPSEVQTVGKFPDGPYASHIFGPPSTFMTVHITCAHRHTKSVCKINSDGKRQ